MKACPECQIGNGSVRLGRRCGLQSAGHPCQPEKGKALGKEKGKSPWSMASRIIVAVTVGGFYCSFIPGDSGANPTSSFPPPAAGKMDPVGEVFRMTEVTAKVVKGKISIPLTLVKDKKIVRFEYEANGIKIPLLSYVTPAGKVVTAISVCEPCRSTRFHIKNTSIVCNACLAEWDLETLQGIKGGCLKYPPDPIPNKVEKGQILIDEKPVIQWRPRV